MKISEETSIVGKIGGTAIDLVNLTIVSRIIFLLDLYTSSLSMAT